MVNTYCVFVVRSASDFFIVETSHNLYFITAIVSDLAKQSNSQAMLSNDFEMNGDENEGTGIQRKLDVVRGKWERPVNTSFIVVASLVDKATNLGGIVLTNSDS